MSDTSELLRQDGWKEVPVDMFRWEMTISEAGLTFNQALTDRLRANHHEYLDPYTKKGDLLLVGRNMTGKLVVSKVSDDENLLCIMSPELITEARLCSGRYLVKLRYVSTPDAVKGYIIEGCVAAEEEQDDDE